MTRRPVNRLASKDTRGARGSTAPCYVGTGNGPRDLGRAAERYLKPIATIDFDTAHYDRDADVLYLSVGDPSRAVDFDESPEGHALRYDENGDLIGITIVGARKLVDEHRDIHVEAPFTLRADALAQVIG